MALPTFLFVIFHFQNLVLFSLKPGFNRPPRLQVHEFDPQWRHMKTLDLSIPGLNYAHDFILLPDYYVFHITPFTDMSTWNVFKILAGWTSPGESFRYVPHLPSQFAVIPRNATSVEDVILVDTQPCHVSSVSLRYCCSYHGSSHTPY